MVPGHAKQTEKHDGFPQCHNLAVPKTLAVTRGLKQASSAYTQETDRRKKINKFRLEFNLPVIIPVLILQYIVAQKIISEV